MLAAFGALWDAARLHYDTFEALGQVLLVMVHAANHAATYSVQHV